MGIRVDVGVVEPGVARTEEEGSEEDDGLRTTSISQPSHRRPGNVDLSDGTTESWHELTRVTEGASIPWEKTQRAPPSPRGCSNSVPSRIQPLHSPPSCPLPRRG